MGANNQSMKSARPGRWAAHRPDAGRDLANLLGERIASLPGVIERQAVPDHDSRIRAFYLVREFAFDGDEMVPFAVLDASGEIRLKVSENSAGATNMGRQGQGLALRAPANPAGVTTVWRIILNAYFALASQRPKSAWNTDQLHDRRIDAAAKITRPRRQLH